MKKTTVIVDLQYGSTGKGLFAGFHAQEFLPDTVVCAFGPNAGHTVVLNNGKKFITTMLPIGCIGPEVKRIMIGPGAVINEAAIMAEIRMFEQEGYRVWENLYVHENAAVVSEVHREAEKAFQRIGSTSKGTAEAMIQKMRRDPKNMNIAGCLQVGIEARVVDADLYNMVMDKGENIQVEGAQGFSLGINQRFYPYATSRECTAWQVLSDCGVPAAHNEVHVIGTLRTFPIRVANRPEGTSGGCYNDQQEITWNELGIPPELTTVTKLPRRIFTFSVQQLNDALRANDCEYLFINFMNYLQGKDAQEHFVDLVQREAHKYGTRVQWLGFGPKIGDVKPRWRV